MGISQKEVDELKDYIKNRKTVWRISCENGLPYPDHETLQEYRDRLNQELSNFNNKGENI